MKKIKLTLLLGLLAGSLIFTSCNLAGSVNTDSNLTETPIGSKDEKSNNSGNTNNTGNNNSGNSNSGNNNNTPKKDVLWSGTCALAWSLGDDNGVVISASAFDNRAIGLKFTFTTSSDEGALMILDCSSWLGGTMSKIVGDGQIVTTGDEANKLAKLTANKTNGTVNIKFDSTTMAKYISKGIKFIGDKATITKIQLLYNESDFEVPGPVINIPENLQPTDSTIINLTSVSFAMLLANGWNLGNTLDANSVGSNTHNTGLETEKSWGMPYTTKEMIQAVKTAGFKSIRIPVSWHNHISNTTNITIDSDWMARVKTIVGWAQEEGLYVILNVHHDNLTESEMSTNLGFCLTSNETLQQKSKTYLEKVWTQIATEFKDYNYSLVFEVLNEPRNKGGADEWNPGENISTYNSIINSYEQVCVNAIRGTGGNNANRFLMCPGYAASPWYLGSYSFPTDTANDKLILSVHAYDPYEFAMKPDTQTTFTDTHKSSLDYLFNQLSSNYTILGRGVIMGEFSASDKNNKNERIKWATYYCSKAKDAAVACVLWDNNVIWNNNSVNGDSDESERHGYLNRTTLEWYFSEIINVVVQ